MAKVDIIIPLYNKCRQIARAIRSIQRQTVQDWHLIVVDDGSTDGSVDIVRGINDSRIEIVSQENQGPGAARNTGIAMASSEFIAFLDADDEWLPCYLENSLDAINNNDVSLVATMNAEWPLQIDMTRHWQKLGITFGKYFLKGDENPEYADYLISFLHVDSSLMYTDLARKYDGFYSKNKCVLGEDTVFFMRIAINEKFMIIGPTAVWRHNEDSDLYQSAKARPIGPHFLDPEIILRYTPDEKRQLMECIIDHQALRTAWSRARNGAKNQAKDLLVKFPNAKKYRFEYYRCLYTIALSRFFPAYLYLKSIIAKPVKSIFVPLARKLHLMPSLRDN